ncbi:hypothetical protein [Paracoccus mutanolyticus]|uniref:hypothetical protein n=1 Tax=Paracoccus mutanolyticus TaxID=1499308 RepID=UPI001CB9029D|nr:hypothetical protein [Paracoccus mutanolyticus]
MVLARRDAVAGRGDHRAAVQILEARPEVIRDSLDLRMVLDQEGASTQDPGAATSKVGRGGGG